jgi:ATP-dependent Clp protease ATP-binding subunit ClpC
MLLQIMEEGHLSDARGRKVDFRNALIVMTSNVGADMIMRKGDIGFNLKTDEILEEEIAYKDMRKKLTDALKRVFRPEFINRVDSVIIFRALNKENLRAIVNLEIDKVSERLQEHNLTLKPTEDALNLIAELGYDREYGARPLKRVIQNKIEDPLSDSLLNGEFVDGDTVLIDAHVGEEQPEIVLRKAKSRKKKAAPPAAPVAAG